MRSFNKITIGGYIGRDAELRHTGQGTAVASFSMATSEKRGDQETTTWFRISVWGKQAESLSQYLLKGKAVIVFGRLKQDEYTDKEGNKRQTLEVNADDVQLLGSKGDADEVTAVGATERVRQGAGLPPASDDIPF